MPLTDTAIRTAKAGEKHYSLNDGGGLSLNVAPNGTKSWHFRFVWVGKQPRISFGTYPELSLKDARDMRDKARKSVAKGIDPRARPEHGDPGSATFAYVANQWHEFKSGRWAQNSRKGSKTQSRRVLDNDILPLIGNTGFADVSRAQVISVVQKIENRGALNIAEKARSWINQIFEYGIISGFRDNNPASGISAIAVEQPPVQHNPILSKSGEDIKALVRGIRDYDGDFITQAALWTLLYTGVRTIELRRAAPGEFDLDAAMWTIPPTAVKQLRGKVKRDGKDVPDYLVPLPTQLLPLLERLLSRTSRYPYAFPGRNNPLIMLSENTVNQAIKRIGLDGKLTGHGLRGTISTALYEMKYPEEYVEPQLSHAGQNKTRAAYDHSSFPEERRAMMQAWADYLGSLIG